MNDYTESVTYKFEKMELEKEFLDKRIGDFFYWGYLRFELYREINKKLTKCDDAGYKVHLDKKNFFEYFLNLTINNPLLKAKKNEVLVISHPRKVFDNGKYKCIYTDFLNDIYANEIVFAEFFYNEQHLKPTFNRNLLYLDYIELIPSFLFKIRGSKVNARKEAEEIVDAIKMYFEIKLEVCDIKNKIEKYYYLYMIRKKMIQRLIKKVSPKVVVEVVGYDFNKMVINEVAKELRIPTIELQHGVMGKGHIAYNYIKQKEYPYMPNKLLVYSNYWKKTCKFPIGNTNIIPVGYPYLESQMRIYPENKDSILNILILSQPIYASVIHDWVEELLEILDTNDIKYRLIYKLHPVEYGHNEALYNDIKSNKNVLIVNNSKMSLYYYFSRAHIQIGATSTAIFEGLAYHLNTYVLNLPGVKEYMDDLCFAGYAVMCNTATELASYILNKNSVQKKEHADYFFEKNAKQNIIEEIDRCINDF